MKGRGDICSLFNDDIHSLFLNCFFKKVCLMFAWKLSTVLSHAFRYTMKLKSYMAPDATSADKRLAVLW